MNKTKLSIALALTMSISMLTACGGDSTTSTSLTTTGNALLGSAFKGPIDGATVRVVDATGNILASGGSNQGKFALADFDLPADTNAVFIETQGGEYTDEATGEVVSPASTGLMTVFTAAELRTIISDRKVVALTPETTILAKLVQKMLASGKSGSNAIADAKQIIQAQLIDDTNPAVGVSGDTLFLIGDLGAAIPSDQSETLARNRAISYSFEANSLNLSPAQVFDLIEKRATDLEDGILDGRENGAATILLTDKDGIDKKLDEIDQKARYGLARSRLLNNTIERLSNGRISDSEREGLAQLGFDADYFNQLNNNNQASENNTETWLAATNLPAFNRLSILSDEDGDPNNNAATYTLTATPDVNVAINAPGDSWLTPMMRYNGSQLPPVIKAKRGDFMTLHLVNDLPVATSIHWHGFKIPGDQDGGPDFPVAAGNSKTYSFSMLQPAAPLWFHPHPDMKTGEQVYKGLAGVSCWKMRSVNSWKATSNCLQETTIYRCLSRIGVSRMKSMGYVNSPTWIERWTVTVCWAMRS
ncbi:multicopper oxidase family protein [endosymbiont of Tevnia jerichonana]|uniref:Blue copper oxidase CueO n=1 Tax=endosymbiont of Tevnia jerichonana (vent Tica) TaxID=1049564 RepID=G2FDH6_9GAMM|nr:multicopper oxidase domain-containing protein [endosymbiont of Tevnia jerichonana]EGW55262.1 blue copper oxidase CueO [endosymbiont of Tevnia jerichonana (vent Tica)]